MFINNTVVEWYYWIVQLHYYNYHKFFGEEIRIRCKKNSAFQEWCQMSPSWWIMHLFTMRSISSPEIPCLCINCRFLVWYESLYVYEIVLSCCSLNCKFISSVLHLYPPCLMISDFGGIIVHGWFHIFTVYIPLLEESLVICGIFVSCCCLVFSA